MVHGEAAKTVASESRLSPLLIPAADAIAFGTWAAAFFAGDVIWRDRRFTITPDGHLNVP
jgi:hypothetical protein